MTGTDQVTGADQVTGTNKVAEPAVSATSTPAPARGPLFPIDVRWPTWLGVRRIGSLQQRIVWLTGLAVLIAVMLTGTSIYYSTRAAMYQQLDAELVEVATLMAERVSTDLDTVGGLNADTLRAANVVLVLVKANRDQLNIPGDPIPFEVGPNEIAVARTKNGFSARTGTSFNGEAYRIVAVPLTLPSQNTDGYALVLGRSLEPTLQVLRQMWGELFALAVLAVALAMLSGWAVARSSLQPVRRLTAALTRITETDDLAGIETEGDRELADLSRSFNSMVRALASSRDRQQRLIADAGHELRTPLTSLRTNIELLIADENSGMLPQGARSDILRDVAAQLGEFTALIADLVQLTREGPVTVAREPVDVEDVLANAVTRAQRRGPSITFDVTYAEQLMLGDSDTLERAFTNLLDNAVKFSPPDGVITVVMDGEHIVISDQGVGIAEDDLPHVFERFYRSDSSRNTPGTGLGLSIVAHTINSHGGWVKAGNTASGGAEFTVWLPPLVPTEPPPYR